jgi:hypothetical protein
MASTDTAAEAALLIEAASQERQALAESTAALVTAQVRAFGGWYDSDAITRLGAKDLARITTPAQRQTSSLTSAYAQRLLRLLLGRTPKAVATVPPGGLRKVPLDTVYGRLADEYRWLTATRVTNLAPGKTPLTPEQVLERVVTRAEVQVDDNLSLAMRDQWHRVMDAAPRQVIGFRRVIHPELVAVGSTTPGPVCGLCLVSADRRYNRDELLPLHDRCRCSVTAVVGEWDGDGDPGSALNATDLAALYNAAGGTTSGKTLKRVKVEVTHHSELGPRLAVKGRHTRTAREAQADATH